MALIPEQYKLGSAFFHSISKTITEINQYPFESNYKSGHNITLQDVFGENVAYALNLTQADLNVTNYPTIIKKYIQISLTEIPGSNKQSYYINDSGKAIKLFIPPVDILDSDGVPSYGYEPKLYTQAGVLIPPTNGAWWVDFYSGIIHFADGFTPDLLGWGTPKLTIFTYIGKSLSYIINSLRQIERHFKVLSQVSSGEIITLFTGECSGTGGDPDTLCIVH